MSNSCWKYHKKICCTNHIQPTGNLDSRTGQEIMCLFHELHEVGNTIVLITHDNGVAQEAERMIRIRDGHVDEVTA
ncbi:hypothetical protein [Blautia caecimuris]|uniref:hypothetical protein n=1 Tax=Blautia caecimuris TaxID=1796615 RepID=UPI0039925067